MAFTIIASPTMMPLGVDCTVKEVHKADVEVTDHPVEQGVNVADHARPKPAEVTIEGIITNTPMDPDSGPYLKDQPGPAELAYLFLRSLHDSPDLVNITTGVTYYDQMMLTAFNVTRDKNTGEALAFEAGFKEIRTVTNATTTVATKQPKAKLPIKTGATPVPAMEHTDVELAEYLKNNRYSPAPR